MNRQAWLDLLAAWADDWAAGRPEAWNDGRFAAAEQQLLDWQRTRIPALDAFAKSRAGLRPYVPVSAFKTVDLAATDVPPTSPLHFETSGTSDGQPGRVRLLDARAYDLSLLAGFRHFVLPDAPPKMRCLSLVPTEQVRPHSSLGHMTRVVMQHVDDGHGGWFLGAQLDLAGLRAALAGAAEDGVPVLVLATSLALELVLQAWPDAETLQLPPGSRLMDTGGPKGRTMHADRPTQHAWLQQVWGLDPDYVVGELGMTELATPRYEPVLRARVRGDVGGQRVYVGPPWLRTVALDLRTQQPLPPGEVGMLAHVDLANLDTPAWILTADLGRVLSGDNFGGGEAIGLEGRVPGSEWRGCGLDAEALVRELAG